MNKDFDLNTLKEKLDDELSLIKIVDFEAFSVLKKPKPKASFLQVFFNLLNILKYKEIEISLNIAIGAGATGLALILSAVGISWVSPSYLKKAAEVLKDPEQLDWLIGLF